MPDRPQLLHECAIVANDSVAPGHKRMRIHAPAIASNAGPGQFCMLEANAGWYPFLRRPMSFERIEGDEVTILYKIEGEGTQLLARKSAGQSIGVQGPLGTGFPIDDTFQRHIIVAGGIGIAPFPALVEALLMATKKAPEVIIAARTADYILCADDLRDRGCAVHLATDDGSLGEKAFACDMLAHLAPTPDCRVYVCGPMIMMKTTSDVAMAAGANCQVALEAEMACGDGACLGCVVEAKTETEGERMVRVCCDGPVFDTTIIDWEAHSFAL